MTFLIALLLYSLVTFCWAFFFCSLQTKWTNESYFLLHFIPEPWCIINLRSIESVESLLVLDSTNKIFNPPLIIAQSSLYLSRRHFTANIYLVEMKMVFRNNEINSSFALQFARIVSRNVFPIFFYSGK